MNKNPGLRHIGIGEIRRRIAGKFMMQIAKQDVIKDAGCLQLCTGQEARSEAAIHAIYKIFDDNKTEVKCIQYQSWACYLTILNVRVQN